MTRSWTMVVLTLFQRMHATIWLSGPRHHASKIVEMVRMFATCLIYFSRILLLLRPCRIPFARSSPRTRCWTCFASFPKRQPQYAKHRVSRIMYHSRFATDFMVQEQTEVANMSCLQTPVPYRGRITRTLRESSVARDHSKSPELTASRRLREQEINGLCACPSYPSLCEGTLTSA